MANTLLASLEDEVENFMPCPYITLNFDLQGRAPELKCGICWASQLEVRGAEHAYTDATPAILPCGHFAGAKCLEKWHAKHPGQCPFCREVFRYKVCGHVMKAKPIDKTTLDILPRTLPDDGRLPDRCVCCLMQAAQAEKGKLKQLARDFMQARAEFAEAERESKPVTDWTSINSIVDRLEKKKMMMLHKSLLDAHRARRNRRIGAAIVESLQQW